MSGRRYPDADSFASGSGSSTRGQRHKPHITDDDDMEMQEEGHSDAEPLSLGNSSDAECMTDDEDVPRQGVTHTSPDRDSDAGFTTDDEAPGQKAGRTSSTCESDAECMTDDDELIPKAGVLSQGNESDRCSTPASSANKLPEAPAAPPQSPPYTISGNSVVYSAPISKAFPIVPGPNSSSGTIFSKTALAKRPLLSDLDPSKTVVTGPYRSCNWCVNRGRKCDKKLEDMDRGGEEDEDPDVRGCAASGRLWAGFETNQGVVRSGADFPTPKKKLPKYPSNEGSKGSPVHSFEIPSTRTRSEADQSLADGTVPYTIYQGKLLIKHPEGYIKSFQCIPHENGKKVHWSAKRIQNAPPLWDQDPNKTQIIRPSGSCLFHAERDIKCNRHLEEHSTTLNPGEERFFTGVETTNGPMWTGARYPLTRSQRDSLRLSHQPLPSY